MANGHSEGDDPFSNQVTLCQQFTITNKNTLNTPLQSVSPADAYNNEDAFGNFSNKQSGVSSLKPSITVSFLLFLFYFVSRPHLTRLITLVPPRGLCLAPQVPSQLQTMILSLPLEQHSQASL